MLTSEMFKSLPLYSNAKEKKMLSITALVTLLYNDRLTWLYFHIQIFLNFMIYLHFYM